MTTIPAGQPARVQQLTLGRARHLHTHATSTESFACHRLMLVGVQASGWEVQFKKLGPLTTAKHTSHDILHGKLSTPEPMTAHTMCA